ncbi:MAG: transglutaminase domain-containing protein [Alphaproteobacteria bacterium]|nr:transglutaminase domain-containing protein [Alphaproteobacteria bacterium]
MRVSTFLFALLLFVFGAGVCNATHYSSSRIKRYATSTPRKVENNLNSLTRYLVAPLDDDYDKAKIIAYWIASHINYDEYLYNGSEVTKLMASHSLQSPEQLLESRVGICSEFAMLFDQMCKIAGIRGNIVRGYAYPAKQKIRGKEKRNYAHAWNYFFYDGEKIYVDTTFMAGGTTSPTWRASEVSHKRALHKVQRDNKYKSMVNDFDDYYFNFSYRNEIKEMNYKHVEK